MHRFRTAREAASRALAAALLVASPLVAQRSTQVSVFGGVATNQVGERSHAAGFAPTLAFANGSTSAQLGGSVTRFATGAWSLGGSTSFGTRVPAAGGVGFTIQGGADVSALHGTASGSFLEAELSPGLEIRLAGATLFAGARAMAGSASQVVPAYGAGLLPSSPTPRASQQSRGGIGWSYGGVVPLLTDAQRSVAISAREDRANPGHVPYVDRTAALAIVNGGASIAVAAGARFAADEHVAFGNATVTLPLAGPASLELSASRYPSNRVLGTPAGQSVSLGMSLRFGAHGDAPAAPSNAPPVAPGRTRLAIRAPDARRVEVAGDFNSWRNIPAQRAPNGVWYVDLRLEPGRYRYAFRVNGAEWRVPDGATAVDDGFGGKSAWLDVR